MKKSIAILLSLALTLLCDAGALAAAAETSVRFVEESPDFDIEMPLPEGASVGAQETREYVSRVEILKEGLATVRITIAPSEIYDVLSLKELSEEDVKALREMAGSQYENPVTTVDTTPSGNQYIYVCANDEYDVDTIFTLYKGYFVELTQWHDDYASLTEADQAFMLELLHNIAFLPIAK